MTRKRTSDFDGIASLRPQDVMEGRRTGPQDIGLAALCLIVLGIGAAVAAVGAAAVLGAPLLFGVILLHN